MEAKEDIGKNKERLTLTEIFDNLREHIKILRRADLKKNDLSIE